MGLCFFYLFYSWLHSFLPRCFQDNVSSILCNSFLSYLTSSTETSTVLVTTPPLGCPILNTRVALVNPIDLQSGVANSCLRTTWESTSYYNFIKLSAVSKLQASFASASMASANASIVDSLEIALRLFMSSTSWDLVSTSSPLYVPKYAITIVLSASATLYIFLFDHVVPSFSNSRAMACGLS